MKNEAEKTITKTENQLDRAQEAEEARILADRREEIAEDDGHPDINDHNKPKRKRLSLGLLRKEKQYDTSESSSQSPRTLKSLVHKFKRRSDIPGTESNTQTGSDTIDFEDIGGTYNEEPAPVADDQNLHDTVENEHFEDAEEDLSTSSSGHPPNNRSSQHRMSFSTGSDKNMHKAARETKFHEVGL